jgi:uncharacterized protein (TIGR00730 family)
VSLRYFLALIRLRPAIFGSGNRNDRQGEAAIKLCIFCGSSPGASPIYAEVAAEVGRALAGRGIGLVYGGGNIGLMGILANAVLAAGGTAHGVISRGLFEREIAHLGLTSLEVVGSMHERKLRMAELADGFLALPGGIGTFEEIFEQWTWAQLGIHAKPCGFLNVAGYFDPLLAMIERMRSERFVDDAHVRMALIDDGIERLIDRFTDYTPPPLKWIKGRTEAIEP